MPNATFIAELVAFLLILGILGRYVLPPVQKAMHDRQEIIRKQLDDAEEAARSSPRRRLNISGRWPRPGPRRRGSATRPRRRGGHRRRHAGEGPRGGDRIVAGARSSWPPSGRPSSASCAPRSARSRSTWPTRIVGESLGDEARSKARSTGSWPNSSHGLGPRTPRCPAPGCRADACREPGGVRAAAEKLDALARGDRADALLPIADEMLAVAGLLGASRGCAGRWPTRPAPARTGPQLLDDVVGGTVSADTREVLRGGRRPLVGADELLDGVERLGVEALLASADRAGELAEVEDELFRFGQVVDGTPSSPPSSAT